MKILLTGFEPFGGSPVNPSIQVVRALAGEPFEHVDLHTAMLPVTHISGPSTLVLAVESFMPDYVLCLGQDSGRNVLSVERVAINLLDDPMTDNAGTLMTDEPIVPDGPAAYFVTLPVRALVTAIRAAGVPAALSTTAGTFLCNQVLYTLLHHIAVHSLPIRAGFIHVPPLPMQVVERPVSSMSLETTASGVRAAVKCLAQTTD